MIGFELPPVGWPIKPKGRSESCGFHFPGEAFFVDSGTSALALALKVVLSSSGFNVSTPQPEVILPAYVCPDLVSAILFAGAVPVPVDLAPSSSWMDLTALVESIGEHTVAIIAVNFLGVPERLYQLRDIANAHNLALIEDNAQAVPFFKDGKFVSHTMIGDLAIMSLGRGKPMSVLGGGVIYAENQHWRGLVQIQLNGLASQKTGVARYKLKVCLYNALLNPYLYWLPANMSFLGVGETEFHPLGKIEGISDVHKRAFFANISAYEEQDVSQVLKLHKALQALPKGMLVDLGSVALAQGLRLLRYPVLFSSKKHRDTFFRRAKEKGLGASLMYAQPLHDIYGLGAYIKNKPSQNTLEFAQRLVTLPSNGLLSDKRIERILSLI